MTAGLNILVIGLALSLPLGFFVVLSNGKVLIGNMPAIPQLTIFMHTDVSTAEIKDIKIMLRQRPEVENVRFISRTEGLKELTEHSGMADVLGGLTDNPLPDAFAVTLKETDPVKLAALQKSVQQLIGVESVLADTAWAERIYALFGVGDVLLKILSTMLAIGLILIMGNSIRMQILTRREEIEVNKLIGATDAFIRRPFVYFAIMQGLLGGMLASGLIWFALSYLNPVIRDFALLYNSQFILVGPDLLATTVVCLTAALLCWCGAMMSVRYHLRQFL
jgi:cell division transport system permease protein